MIDSDCRIPHMTKHMATELITGVHHFQKLIDKPIKLEISLTSFWRSSQLECKTESARIEAYFSLYTPLLPLRACAILSEQIGWMLIRCAYFKSSFVFPMA